MSAVENSKEFRATLGAFATGVTIVTACSADGEVAGVTASSFNSVSLDPPMVLWSLARTSGSLPIFESASHFAVHVLAADQEDLSNRFARGGADKFAGLACGSGAGNAPLLDGVAAHFECRIAYRYDGGDHIILVGEVEKFSRSDLPPLLFHGGRYMLAAKKIGAFAPGPSPDMESGTFGTDFLGYLFGRAHFQIYARMRPALERLGLDLSDHFALSVLGIAGSATPDEIEALIGYTGYHFSAETARGLAARGLVAIEAQEYVSLSATGRQKFLELTAAAKAIEEEILDLLDPSETALLRQLLKQVIGGTNPGLPDLWKDQITGAGRDANG